MLQYIDDVKKDLAISVVICAHAACNAYIGSLQDSINI